MSVLFNIYLFDNNTEIANPMHRRTNMSSALGYAIGFEIAVEQQGPVTLQALCQGRDTGLLYCTEPGVFRVPSESKSKSTVNLSSQPAIQSHTVSHTHLSVMFRSAPLVHTHNLFRLAQEI
jgi:hypothetical protein